MRVSHILRSMQVAPDASESGVEPACAAIEPTISVDMQTVVENNQSPLPISSPSLAAALNEVKELRAVLCEVLMAEAIPAEDEIYQSTASSVWEILEGNLRNRAGAAAKMCFVVSAEEDKRGEAWHTQHIIEHGCSGWHHKFVPTDTGMSVFFVCECGAEQDVTDHKKSV